MLYAGGNVYNVAGTHFDGRLAPLPIITAACKRYQYLSAALVGVMNVPIIAATRLERYVENAYLLLRDGAR